MAKQRISFRDKVAANTEKQKRDASSYGYLMLPKDVKVFSPKPDQRVKLDFLMYEVSDERHPDRDDKKEVATPGTLWWKRPFKVHRNIGGGDGDTVVCLTSIGKKCPICEARTKMKRDGADKEDTDALKPSERNLYVVIPLDSKDHDAIPHVFDISWAMFQKKLNQELEENPDYMIFPDVQEGLTLKVRFEERTIGKSKPFPEAGRIDFFERDKKYTDKILDHSIDLDKMLKILTYEELDRKFLEIEDDDVAEGETAKGKSSDTDDVPEINTRRRPAREQEPEEELNWEALKAMSTRRLLRTAKEKELQINPEDYPESAAEDLLLDVAKELGIKPPSEKSKITTTEEEKKPVRRARREEVEEEKVGKKDKCPHGHKFGVDTDAFKDCKTCKVWDDCMDENDRLNA